MPTTDPLIYDQDSYYDGDGRATRLSPSLSGLLYLMDWSKARGFIHRLNKLSRGSNLPGNSTLTDLPPRILDVGAGDGKFLFFMRKFGFEPFGTTASQISQEAGRKLFQIDLEYSLSIPEKFYGLNFCAMTYWHVFEHLEYPEEHVAAWDKLLGPSSTIMVEVPNIESIGARLSFDAWLGSDIKHHINHMTKAQIERLLSRFNFKIVRHEGFSLKFSYSFLWSALLGRIFGKRYSFDAIFAFLKSPFKSFKAAPLLTLNATLSVFYLFPLILPLIGLGLVTGKGEVTRLFIKKSLQNDNAS